jgi:dTDP-4-amino-4,6-dideoxygalactose transaminase
MRIEAMLRAAGIGVGDEVIVPSFGSVEVAQEVARAGAEAVFADINGGTYCLDADAVDAVVSPRTAAVIAVHTFGYPVDLPGLREVGSRHGLLVLERREPVTGSALWGERSSVAGYLSARLRGLVTPVAVEGHTFTQYVVRVPGNGRPDRDAFARAARSKGVDCRVPVQTPVHRMAGYRAQRRDVPLPETERAADETLAIALDGPLSKRGMHRIVANCNALGGLLQPAL